MPEISVRRPCGGIMPAVMGQAPRKGRSVTVAAPLRPCWGQESLNFQCFAPTGEMTDFCERHGTAMTG
jgi:hypothetical protein